MNHLFCLFVLTASLIAFSACSSHPIKPESKNVEVSREDAGKKCQEIGRVEGRVKNVKGTFEEALEDLKLDAARKGANYVKMEQTGAMGQSVAGVAYFCN
jgi:hypothetical protein